MIWNHLVKLALLGTARSSLPLSVEEKMNSLGVDTSRELSRLVLESAAIESVLLKAGFEPQIDENKIPETCQQEVLPVCSFSSASHLRQILSGTYPSALAEFVRKIVQQKKILPFELLPDLFEKCLKNEYLWNSILPAIGKRGEWLIAFNPEWEELNQSLSSEIWATGSKSERIRFLNKVRQENPTIGLDLVKSTWEEDSLPERILFLKIMETGLSSCDELFLEQCLLDTRKEIRVQALILLALLPGSRLISEVDTLLQLAVKIVNKGKELLMVDAEPIEDFLHKNLFFQPSVKWLSNERGSGMILPILVVFPPGRLSVFLKKKPGKILELFSQQGDKWLEVIIKTTVLHRDADWMEAILSFFLQNERVDRWSQLNLNKMLEILPDSVFNKVIFEKLKATKYLPEEESPLVKLLLLKYNEWGVSLAKIIMRQLFEWISVNRAYLWTGYQYRLLLKNAAYRVDTTAEKEISRMWLQDPTIWSGWEKEIRYFLTVLKFRSEMLIELEKK